MFYIYRLISLDYRLISKAIIALSPEQAGRQLDYGAHNLFGCFLHPLVSLTLLLAPSFLWQRQSHQIRGGGRGGEGGRKWAVCEGALEWGEWGTRGVGHDARQWCAHTNIVWPTNNSDLAKGRTRSCLRWCRAGCDHVARLLRQSLCKFMEEHPTHAHMLAAPPVRVPVGIV